MPKTAIFGQDAPYIGSESNYCQKWQKFESNYCKNWQYLDKSSSIMDAKSCQKWQKNVEQKATGTQWFEPPNITRLFPTTCLGQRQQPKVETPN